MSRSWDDSLARLKPLVSNVRVEGLSRVLLGVEREINLINRFTPLNFASEVSRLRGVLESGDFDVPHFIYRSLEDSRERLVAVSRALHGADIYLSEQCQTLADPSWACLCALLKGRVGELSLEFDLLRARGTDEVLNLSRARYCVTDVELRAADELAKKWFYEGSACRENEHPTEERLLAAQLTDWGRKENLEVRVVESPLATVAAQGDDCVFVQRGARTNTQEARRIWAHEVHAHLLPRRQARRNGLFFAIGTTHCAADEEGRALLFEERWGAMGALRRKSLAIRHLLASALRQSSTSAPDSIVEAARLLIEEGATCLDVASNLSRVLRGGGLGREIIYLPGFLRVSTALNERPELEIWMEQGRISISGAQILSGLVGNLVPR